MNTRFRAAFSIILTAAILASASGAVDAGKGNGGGSGNGAMYGPGPASGYGYDARNSNQYRHQNQHQYQYRKGHGGNASGSVQSLDAGKDQFSTDKYLNQKDFQTWLNQNQSKVQNHDRVQTMDQGGI